MPSRPSPPYPPNAILLPAPPDRPHSPCPPPDPPRTARPARPPTPLRTARPTPYCPVPPDPVHLHRRTAPCCPVLPVPHRPRRPDPPVLPRTAPTPPTCPARTAPYRTDPDLPRLYCPDLPALPTRPLLPRPRPAPFCPALPTRPYCPAPSCPAPPTRPYCPAPVLPRPARPTNPPLLPRPRSAPPTNPPLLPRPARPVLPRPTNPPLLPRPAALLPPPSRPSCPSPPDHHRPTPPPCPVPPCPAPPPCPVPPDPTTPSCPPYPVPPRPAYRPVLPTPLSLASGVPKPFPDPLSRDFKALAHLPRRQGGDGTWALEKVPPPSSGTGTDPEIAANAACARWSLPKPPERGLERETMSSLPPCGLYQPGAHSEPASPRGASSTSTTMGTPAPASICRAGGTPTARAGTLGAPRLPEASWAEHLEPLLAEGLYRVREAFTCWRSAAAPSSRSSWCSSATTAWPSPSSSYPRGPKGASAFTQGTLVDRERLTRLAPLKVAESEEPSADRSFLH